MPPTGAWPAAFDGSIPAPALAAEEAGDPLLDRLLAALDKGLELGALGADGTDGAVGIAVDCRPGVCWARFGRTVAGVASPDSPWSSKPLAAAFAPWFSPPAAAGVASPDNPWSPRPLAAAFAPWFSPPAAAGVASPDNPWSPKPLEAASTPSGGTSSLDCGCSFAPWVKNDADDGFDESGAPPPDDADPDPDPDPLDDADPVPPEPLSSGVAPWLSEGGYPDPSVFPLRPSASFSRNCLLARYACSAIFLAASLASFLSAPSSSALFRNSSILVLVSQE
ncbi:hypothetical protein BN979_02351 [Mycolicibacterium vulneris]|nr:hypothetical protein BN979_02351 [Mycolicibacterium vulneris]